MSFTRRDFVKAGVAVATTLPRPLLVRLGRAPEAVPPIDDPRLKVLTSGALEAARAAGAAYADARLTHDYRFGVYTGGMRGRTESLTVGVRALVNGYWGFASGPLWSPEEVVRLGREAVHQAKVNSLGKPRTVDLAPVPAVSDGHWVMPVKVDPFEISPDEMADYLNGLSIFTGLQMPGAGLPDPDGLFWKQEKAFASTEGSFCTQRLYRSGGRVTVTLKRGEREVAGFLDGLSYAGVGWELFRDQPLRERIWQTLAELDELLKLPVKPVDVGRYDTVFEAKAVAGLLDVTLGRATELDRALGFEANAEGTSYINEPFDMLGTYQAGAPQLMITGNRADPGGCATVQWDDEGVVPDEFTLVKDGILTDFQSTRESAGWLKSWYAQHGRAFRSHGCANAPTASYAQMEHSPNLAMKSGPEAVDFDGLVAGLGKGIAVKSIDIDTDFQNLNGELRGRTFEIKGGKRVAVLNGAGIIFRAPELWRGLMALGGPASVRRYAAAPVKGEPRQGDVFHSVSAPPAVFKQLTLIDYLWKA